MRLLMKVIFSFVLLFLLACPVLSYQNPGDPEGFLNDYAYMLNPAEEERLENKLAQFDKETSNEIAVVTISDLGGDVIENYAVKLFEDWKIGKGEKDNGVLILIAKSDRQMRIEVGYGLEAALTDAQCSWIISDIMAPAFREYDYYEGIDSAVDKIMAATRGEYVPGKEGLAVSKARKIVDNIFGWIVIIVIFLAGLVLGESRSWWQGGVIGAILGMIFGFSQNSMLISTVGAIVLGLIGLVYDFLVSYKIKGKTVLGGKNSWLGGISGGSRGSGGGSFGGFGGGSSGGGGASGSW